MRYRFYREHKYVSFMLTEYERLLAKTDFSSISAVNALKEPLRLLHALMNGHAAYENSAIHELLRQKSSTAHEAIEKDHEEHEQQFEAFTAGLENITNCADEQMRQSLGYLFYLSFRFFVAENLRHIHIEETVIMPALQKLYSDEELSTVEAKTYDHMTSEQMIQMMEHLFPHMDLNDKIFFLGDIKKTQPEKFSYAWLGVATTFNLEERISIIKKLDLETTPENALLTD